MMSPRWSFGHSWPLFLQSGAAKGHPKAPKGGTKEPKASLWEAKFRLLFTTYSSQAAGKAPRHPKEASTYPNRPQRYPPDTKNASKLPLEPNSTHRRLSYPWQKTCINPSISPEQPKLTKTSRCGGVASAFSISIYRSEGFTRTGYFFPGRDGTGAWTIWKVSSSTS